MKFIAKVVELDSTEYHPAALYHHCNITVVKQKNNVIINPSFNIHSQSYMQEARLSIWMQLLQIYLQ